MPTKEYLLSANRVSELILYQYPPKDLPKAILQISHGMCEHLHRYRPLWEYLNQYGILVCGIDHVGHGEHCDPKDLGYIPGGKNLSVLVEDQKQVYDRMRRIYRHLPYILLGHSMGSFIARKFAADYPDALDGMILSGTRTDTNGLAAGKLLTALLGFLRGKHYRSSLVQRLSNQSMTDRYPDPLQYTWLSRDETVVREYLADPCCGFCFTVSAYHQMFGLLQQINTPAWEEKIPLRLPVFICGGSEDPICNYGHDLQLLHDRMEERYHSDLRLRIYEGARHEVHNDLCRNEVFADWRSFIEDITDGVNAAIQMEGRP